MPEFYVIFIKMQEFLFLRKKSNKFPEFCTIIARKIFFTFLWGGAHNTCHPTPRLLHLCRGLQWLFGVQECSPKRSAPP